MLPIDDVRQADRRTIFAMSNAHRVSFCFAVQGLASFPCHSTRGHS